MATYTKGNLITEGKTKRVWEVTEDESLVIIENKSDITAYDNPELTKQFDTKAIYATETTCRVFELLKQAGIPVAYVQQISPTEFVAQKCSMIKLEVVGRRYPVGSYVKRNPQFQIPESKTPLRFHRLVVEFFLKTTRGKLIVTGANGEIVIEGLDPEQGEEDPFISNPYGDLWDLTHSKKPLWDPSAKLRGIPASLVLQSQDTERIIKDLESYLRDTFLVLEGMWAILGYYFVDMKIELGITIDGTIVIADGIDNDSWRLRDQGWQELSKEAFRQGEGLDEVERKYGIVADLVKNFRIPKQCLVLWKDSADHDEFLNFSQDITFSSIITIEEITASGHKSPSKCLRILGDLLSKYPDGGVIITKVGMSNGLGPMIAARTSWPVISIPATLDENPEDIWSSLRMPSEVPMAVIPSQSNAISFALRILAQKNPLLYQQLQKRIEKLDE